MFSLNDNLRYWLFSEPTDMRKSFHTLSGLVTDRMNGDPLNGDVYIFMNKARNRIKLLHWEPGGMVIYSKLLEAGTFGSPSGCHKDEVAGTIESLKSEKSALEWEVGSLEAEKSSLESKVGGLESAKTSLESKVSDLERQLEYLRRKVFGKMSEKRLPLDPAVLNEPTLFGDLLTDEEKARLAAEADKAEQEITRKVSVRKSSRPVRKPLDVRGLEIRERHIYPNGVLDSEGNLLPEYTEIGVESTDRLEHIPEQFYVSRDTRHKVALRSSIQIAEPDRKPILIAPLPPQVIERGIAGASVLADMEIKKYRFHLPFYRIHQQYKDIGMNISPSTLDGWREAAVEKLKYLYHKDYMMNWTCLISYQENGSRHIQKQPARKTDKQQTKPNIGKLWRSASKFADVRL